MYRFFWRRVKLALDKFFRLKPQPQEAWLVLLNTPSVREMLGRRGRCRGKKRKSTEITKCIQSGTKFKEIKVLYLILLSISTLIYQTNVRYLPTSLLWSDNSIFKKWMHWLLKQNFFPNLQKNIKTCKRFVNFKPKLKSGSSEIETYIFKLIF